ncbi:hypothetical protein HG530_005426 [Fusarium avenaceum]|nr:hypothetical protein HG530_005426 [Fusarium avenaceum]
MLLDNVDFGGLNQAFQKNRSDAGPDLSIPLLKGRVFLDFGWSLSIGNDASLGCLNLLLVSGELDLAQAKATTFPFRLFTNLSTNIILSYSGNIVKQTLNDYTLVHTLQRAGVEDGKDSHRSQSSRVSESENWAVDAAL